MADALRELSQHTIKVFSENADSSQSAPMSAYMRDKFPFLGIRSQDRRGSERIPHRTVPLHTRSPRQSLSYMRDQF
ncbi:MAG TPA: hypothetical protein GX530_07290, partial [Corynebacteriales bacterium]|nr:hypothetical protein [Mycobacteriales bacterium]